MRWRRVQNERLRSAQLANANAAAAAIAAVAAAAAAAAAGASGEAVESSVLFASTHLFEHFPDNPDFDFFPGRGGPDVAVPTRPVPPAAKPLNVATGSQGGNGKGTPASAASASAAAASSSASSAVSLGGSGFRDSTAGPVGPGGYAAGTFNPCPSVLNLPLEPLWVRTSRVKDASNHERLRGRAGFRTAVTDKLAPALQAFKPELLLISAGFDGAAGDDGNAQDDVGGLDLTDEDFKWVTQRLCAAVGPECPVVSVLEGGYGTWEAAIDTYNRATLASGCAAHVAALCAHSRTLRPKAKPPESRDRSGAGT